LPTALAMRSMVAKRLKPRRLIPVSRRHDAFSRFFYAALFGFVCACTDT
jgi:hypothetical protein